MSKSIANFTKSKGFIICIDSDGSAIDSMNVKHNECFAPCLIEQFGLQKYDEIVKKQWAHINLFSQTRGVNRFKTLYYLLKYADENLCEINDLKSLEDFVMNSKELSNSALKAQIEKTNSEILKISLAWSIAVNNAIELLPKQCKKAYEGVREFLQEAQNYCDIAIVSSANYEALLSEWHDEKLMPYVDVVMSQNDGSKTYCIGELIKKGYTSKNVLMVGDAPQDLQSAKQNDVYFYPILVNSETQCWHRFKNEVLQKFLNSNYENLNNELETLFLQNLE